MSAYLANLGPWGDETPLTVYAVLDDAGEPLGLILGGPGGFSWRVTDPKGTTLAGPMKLAEAKAWAARKWKP